MMSRRRLFWKEEMAFIRCEVFGPVEKREKAQERPSQRRRSETVMAVQTGLCQMRPRWMVVAEVGCCSERMKRVASLM